MTLICCRFADAKTHVVERERRGRQAARAKMPTANVRHAANAEPVKRLAKIGLWKFSR